MRKVKHLEPKATKMVCNCIVDKPTYPQNHEWGPLLWWILHTLAEKAGRQTDPLLQADEGRAWPLFVKELPGMLPCPYCRDHLQDYLRATPFALPTDPAAWRAYVPTFFYELHEAVNARLDKPSFPRADLTETYKNPSAFKEKLTALQSVEERAIKQQGVTLFAWRAWLKQLTLLRATIL
jgi:hypothetical protein